MTPFQISLRKEKGRLASAKRKMICDNAMRSSEESVKIKETALQTKSKN